MFVQSKRKHSHYSVFFSGNPVYLDSLCIACLFLYSLYMCYSFDHSSVNYKHTFWWLMHLKSLCFVAPHCCILGHSSHGIFIGRLMNARLHLVHNPPTLSRPTSWKHCTGATQLAFFVLLTGQGWCQHYTFRTNESWVVCKIL